MNICERISNNVLYIKSVKVVVITYFKMNAIKIDKMELSERIMEFEIVKKGEVDYISLNNLFDFYNEDFDLEKMKILIEREYKNEKKISQYKYIKAKKK